jgi:hypothetical protein
MALIASLAKGRLDIYLILNSDDCQLGQSFLRDLLDGVDG